MAVDSVQVFSAGSEPSRVNPFAIRVLQDRGIDTSAQFSKSVQEFVNQPFDFVITLCDEEVCPYFPGAATRLHWGMPDPSATQGDNDDKLESFRRTAEAIETRLIPFLNSLNQPESNLRSPA